MNVMICLEYLGLSHTISLSQNWRRRFDRWSTQWIRNLQDGHIQWELRSMSWCQSGKQWRFVFLRGQYWGQDYSKFLLETWTVAFTFVWTAQATQSCAGICILGDTRNLTGCGVLECCSSCPCLGSLQRRLPASKTLWSILCCKANVQSHFSSVLFLFSLIISIVKLPFKHM